MKYKKILYILLCIVALMWMIRVIYIQKVYAKILSQDNVYEYENNGEYIPFGDNYTAFGEFENLDGYYIKVNDIEFYDVKTYMEDIVKTDEMRYYDESVVYGVYEVTVSIKNDGNSNDGIRLPSIELKSDDYVCYVNYDWYMLINDMVDEEGSLANVEKGCEKEYKLPFMLTYYRESFGRSVETDNLWLSITLVPDERWIKIR